MFATAAFIKQCFETIASLPTSHPRDADLQTAVRRANIIQLRYNLRLILIPGEDKTMGSNRMLLGTVILLQVSAAGVLRAEVERFPARDGDALELWRVTNDPLVRDHAEYHNTQCWSPDGRYLSYVHHGADERQYGAQAAAEIHLFDLLTQMLS